MRYALSSQDDISKRVPRNPAAATGLYRYHLERIVYASCHIKRRKPSLNEEINDVIHIPIDGVLDLHTFDPKEAASLVHEYLNTCLEEGIYEVKIIHGKGKGVLRRTVHAVLEKHPAVVEVKLDTGPSSWGATIVRLTPT
ncbi:MAG: Smr/MutS family protein [Deltaproteobacteria bacterium]|nr:Smr/MutS family protein [Deltaproteobacteria bacterium]